MSFHSHLTHSVVVTNLDHDGNVTPWTLMAEEKGIAVRRYLIFIVCQDDEDSGNAMSNCKDRGVAEGYWKSILLIPLVQMFQLSPMKWNSSHSG